MSVIEQSIESRKKEQSKESADFLISFGPDNNIPNPKDYHKISYVHSPKI
jgi:hypothetical protein